jgi:hypothetical protein
MTELARLPMMMVMSYFTILYQLLSAGSIKTTDNDNWKVMKETMIFNDMTPAFT